MTIIIASMDEHQACVDRDVMSDMPMCYGFIYATEGTSLCLIGHMPKYTRTHETPDIRRTAEADRKKLLEV